MGRAGAPGSFGGALHVRGRPTDRRTLRIGIALEAFCGVWTVVEGAVGIGSGVVAHPLSLEAFGVDSALEVISVAVVLWWLLLPSSGADPERTHAVSEFAERVVGLGLFTVAAYVIAGAAYQLVSHREPDASAPGLILAAVTVFVMPALFGLKRRNAERLGSGAMRGDAY